MSDLLADTVRSNAEWCARICALHGAKGRFGFAAWVCDHKAPLHYPNVITLRADCVTAQTETLSQLGHLRGAWGVKDSFAALDLEGLGFRAAIHGRWVRHRETAGVADALDWRRVETPHALANWEAAWGGERHRGQDRIFLLDLLRDESIHVFEGYAGAELVAGGIVNQGASVAGLSNTFALRPDLRAGVVHHALHLAGGQPLVGWEADEADLDAETLGRLRVWLRDRP